MQTKIAIPAFAAFMLFAGCAAESPKPPAPSTYVSVMIDNHEDARPYQRGLTGAVFVQEQLVEGFITRFEVLFDVAQLPDSVGPIRSVRTYFLDGIAPLVPAIFHVGGSPEAMEILRTSKTVTSFSGIHDDAWFDYDDVAPAPHNRFITRENMQHLLARLPEQTPILLPFTYGDAFTSSGAATHIGINYFSPLHNVTYEYNAAAQRYDKYSDDTLRPPSPANILMLETDVEVVGPLGRLAVDMKSGGKALLFRDGGMAEGTWSKTGTGFFVLNDTAGKPFVYKQGQIWMIVLDSLDRVTWTGSVLTKDRP